LLTRVEQPAGLSNETRDSTPFADSVEAIRGARVSA
jgi:hypothetical protein